MKVFRRGWLLWPLAFFLLGLLYDWATPIFEATDEGYHVAFIRWVTLGQGLPVQDPVHPGQWLQEGSQPPLYHLLSAAAVGHPDWSDWSAVFVRNPFLLHYPGIRQNINSYWHLPSERFPFSGTAQTVHRLRWLSLVMGALSVLSVYGLARQLFPQQRHLAHLAAALVALNPKFLFVSASVNNDNLLVLLSTASLTVMLPLMRAEVTHFWRRVLGLGVLLGLAALTKISGLVLWPVALLAVGWGAWQARQGRRAAGLLGVFGIAVLICGWWYVRNLQLYGEWLGLSTMVAIAGPRTPPITLWQLIRDEWYGFYRSYWGVFGVFTILEPSWIQWFWNGLTVWALAAGLRHWVRRPVRPRPELLLLAVFCGLTLIGVINWSLQTLASQGRLMFGAIAPLSIFLAYGVLGTDSESRWKTRAVRALILGMGLIAILTPLWVIAPRYTPPTQLAEADLPDELRPLQVTIDGAFELVGYTFADQPRQPGTTQSITLYWRALQPMRKDYVLSLLLLGRAAEPVGKLDTWPGGGLKPTSLWQPGEMFADNYDLPILPEATTPSLLELNIHVWVGVPQQAVPLVTPAGETIPSVTTPVGRVVAEAPPPLSPNLTLASTFDGEITLMGATIGTEGLFKLYWQTAQPVLGDYTVFAHLLDADGVQVTQADSPPLNGDWPTWAWLPNRPFAETRQFNLAGLAPGHYTIEVGLYDPHSLERLAAYRMSGERWPADGVLIKDAIEIK